MVVFGTSTGDHNSETMNSIDFGGHRSKVNVMMEIIE